MRSYPHSNFPAFDEMAKRLGCLGHQVVSPAEHDRSLGFNGDTWTTNTVGISDKFLADVLKWDLEQIFDCDGIMHLKGWEKSSGGRVEHELGVYLKLKLFYEDGMESLYFHSRSV